MARRRHTSRKHSSGKSRLWRIIFVLIVGATGWWAFTFYATTQAKVTAYTSGKGHSFMVVESEKPTLLIIEKGSQPSQLDSLAIMRLDLAKRKASLLRLPADLSDGTTTAAQYLESGYYKELQQMIEQTLALPISGYLVQTSSGGDDWTELLARQPKPTWWQSTLNLPWWLQDMPDIKTSLSTWQLLQTIWVVRDAAETNIVVRDADQSSFFDHDGMKVADTAQLDRTVSDVLLEDSGELPNVSVVVKNATNVTGLASMMSRFVKHMGGEVIAVEASDSGQSNSSIKSETRTRLSDNMSELLGIKFVPTPRTGRERADVEFIVGLDTLNRVGEPLLPAPEAE